jgi:hypothetical protein
MAGNKEGKGHASRAEGLETAIDRAWADYKSNHGAPPGNTLTIQSIQVEGNNPIHTYIVIVGGP